ncbi:MAG: carboxypeptidase-like regulatory domain-containing protein [Chitinophagaceae bacterium]
MRVGKNLLLIAALLPLSALASDDNGKDAGKAEPVIFGLITDASTKKPVQGVTVSISSNKGQDRKEFVSDAGGSFKVSQLPLGEVVIVLEKKGYKPFRKEGVVIKENVSQRLNFDMVSVEEEDSDVFWPLMRMMDGE